MSSFHDRIGPAVRTELVAAARENRLGNRDAAFRHLERAHVLGQASTRWHVQVHWLMLGWALRHRRPREVAGQWPRLILAATKTAMGKVPRGNTGGSNVSPFRAMPIASDLQRLIDAARH